MHLLRAFLASLIALAAFQTAGAVPAKIVKVLPYYLDLEGRHALSPSLFERDAYQAQLRRNPAQCSGIRFDVQWKVKTAELKQLKLRVEIRASKDNAVNPIILEQQVSSRHGLRRWSSLEIKGDDYNNLGKIIGWRVTLWDSDKSIAEQKSFLW